MVNERAGKWEHVQNPYSLIVGIDNYAHATKLTGAVADAKHFEKFLLDEVKVKPERIQTLFNEEAARDEIAKAFRLLWESDSIKHGDSLIIYFAGHGCKLPRPKCWDAGGQEEIEGIFPQDVQPQCSGTRTNFPIPDFTMAAWLNIISYEKGNNITVIFDCCHSASSARGSAIARAEKFEGNLPDEIDKGTLDILKNKIPSRFKDQHARSHVFLAACGSKEYAFEEEKRGVFTLKLLEFLEGRDVGELTYVELMKCLGHNNHLKRMNQTPQCEGLFKNRMLFSNVLKLGWGVFPTIRDKLRRDTYHIQAGSIHGVDNNSLFDIYETAAIDTKATNPLCRLRARDVDALHTTAIMEPGSAVNDFDSGFACQVCSGNALKVHFSSALLSLVSEAAVLKDIKDRVVVAQDAQSADFLVDIRDRAEDIKDKPGACSEEDTKTISRVAVFTTNLKIATNYGFRQFPQTVPVDPERIADVLRAASQWKQHLEISTNSEWVKNICIEFVPLEKVYGIGLRPLDPINGGKNEVFLKVDLNGNDDEYYGMTIRNRCALDLHVSIVLFDIEELQIVPWHTGAIGIAVNGNADASLPHGKYMPIGYGNGGVSPFQFTGTCGTAVTFVKLYITTMPMDLEWLQQASPFVSEVARGIVPKTEVVKHLTAPEPGGATIVFAIIQNTQ